MDEGLTDLAVLEEAEVSRTTWWRMCKGKDFPMSRLRKIERAVDDLLAARIREKQRLASVPATPPNEAGARGAAPLPAVAPQAGS